MSTIEKWEPGNWQYDEMMSRRRRAQREASKQRKHNARLVRYKVGDMVRIIGWEYGARPDYPLPIIKINLKFANHPEYEVGTMEDHMKFTGHIQAFGFLCCACDIEPA